MREEHELGRGLQDVLIDFIAKLLWDCEQGWICCRHGEEVEV